jgi:ribosomal-protein-alanine N-acetyltransferase
MESTSFSIRRGSADDLEAIAAVQALAVEAAQWPPADYLVHEVWVAEAGGELAGFLVGRTLGGGDSEVLNVAVAPKFRRQGVGQKLISRWLQDYPGTVWLEVRESNSGAGTFYQVLGFTVVGRREGYYSDTGEAAIVLKFHSC